VKNKVVAEFDLVKEQPVLATCPSALCLREEGREAGQPFIATAGEVLSREGVGQLHQAIRP
jgi:hypothetical protein